MTTFLKSWRDAVTARGPAPFLIYETPDERLIELSYSEFDGLIQQTCAMLAAKNVGAGERIMLVLRNSPLFVSIWLAAMEMGSVIVPVDPRATDGECARYADAVRPSLIVVGRTSNASLDELSRLAATLEVDEDDIRAFEPYSGIATADERGRFAATAPLPASPAAILFTSGTTSAPKGAIVTQANYRYVGEVMGAAAALRPDDRLLVVLPLFHANAQYYSFCAAICSGASVALTSGFSASRFLLQASRLGATCVSLFAAPIRMILAKAIRPSNAVALRHVWYAQSVSNAQYEEFSRLVGCRPRQLYGMTETVVAVTTNAALNPIPGSMGRQTVGARIAVISPDTGAPAGLGEVGEIAVAGTPGQEIFAGYLGAGDPAADGWFRTGDFARLDVEGNYWFVGRRSDVLKVSGENVSTVEVEEVVSAHPSVHEAAVVGEPDPVRDEVPVAYVVLVEGSTVTAEDLVAWCAERLSTSKRPRSYHFVDELPRTSVGKVKKYQLSG